MLESKREQIKLRAAYCNGVAVSMIAVAGFGVAIGLVEKYPDAQTIGFAMVAMIAALIMSLLTHALAARSLRDLDQAE